VDLQFSTYYSYLVFDQLQISVCNGCLRSPKIDSGIYRMDAAKKFLEAIEAHKRQISEEWPWPIQKFGTV